MNMNELCQNMARRLPNSAHFYMAAFGPGIYMRSMMGIDFDT